MNHHDTLGVSSNASAAEIKQAFRNAAKEVHPDHSDSPEAAEAFARIKEAHDALIKEAEAPRESVTTTTASARAAAATVRAAYAPQPAQTQLSDDELHHIQDLDQAARTKAKRTLFGRAKESAEVRRHRNKLKTNERRLRGRY